MFRLGVVWNPAFESLRPRILQNRGLRLSKADYSIEKFCNTAAVDQVASSEWRTENGEWFCYPTSIVTSLLVQRA